jgi:hypothetical protein
MRHTPDPEQAVEPCQAIPGVARRGWRTDLLCASVANTQVAFRGRQVPVCRIHREMYARWGAEAEARARELWGWQDLPRPPDQRS